MEDKVRSILRRYAGQNVEFAIDFDIEGKTLVDHISSLIKHEKELSHKEGKKEAFSLAKDICTSAKTRQELLKIISMI